MEKEKQHPRSVIYTADDIGLNSLVSSIGCKAKIEKGDVYSAFGRITSIVGEGAVFFEDGTSRREKLTIKSAYGFDNNIMRAYDALAHWRAYQPTGAPSSAASFFRRKFMHMKAAGEFSSRTLASANSMREYITGGWVESFHRGYVYSPVYHYDLNKAYLGAIANTGLPSRTYPYQKGLPGFVVLAKNVKGDSLPNFFNAPRVLITNEDIDAFGITGFDPIIGVSFRDLDVNLNRVIYELSSLPEPIFKRLTQAFWGVFAMRDPVEVSYKSGKKRDMQNYLQSVCWSQLIIRRVAQEVYRRAKELGAISIFVDSILAEEKMSEEYISDEPGTWKLVDTYDRGIYIENAGNWNPLPFNPKTARHKWKKHSGYSAPRLP